MLLSKNKIWNRLGFVKRRRSNEEMIVVKQQLADNPVDLERKIYPVIQTETSVDMMSECRNILIRYGSKKNAIKAEDVLKGMIRKNDISLPVDWMFKNVQDRGLCYTLHAMAFLDGIYVEFEKTGDTKYKELIMKYMIDWVKGNDIQLRENEWAWHDDATARRVLRMSYYYSLFRNSFTEEERQLVENSLHEQAMLLMDEDFYASKHNHGMYQDFGLLVYTLLIVNDTEEKEKNLETVFARTGEYLNCVFTKDGVHKEHSPYYARDVFAEARRFIKIAKDICPTFSEDIGEVIKNTEYYLVQLIKPNGMWPSLGDSPESDMKNGMKMFKDIPEYQYLISKGTTGIRPKENMVFPQGGYAFMRSSWDDKAHEATWMMLTAATFSSTHKHGDDLSFLLYHKGDLFVEAGKRDYNYSNEQTAWVYSAYAHNVLLVNGEGFPVKVGENGFQSIYPDALQTQILDYDMDGEVKWVKACQKRYKNIVQERTVSYDKARALVSVEDCITSTKDFDGTLLYHLAEDIRVELTDCGWNLYREEELVASVLVRSEEKYTLTSIIGNEGKSPYNTWIFGGASEPSFGSLLKVDVSCHAGENKIVLDIFLNDIPAVLEKKIYPVVKTETSVDMMSECRNILMRHGSKKNAIKAEDVLEGVVRKNDISLPVNWIFEGVHDRGFCHALHAMTFLDSIYVEFENTGDIKDRELIKNYMIDWVQSNPIQLRDNEWAWNDDVTARRVLRMSYYYSLFGNSFTEEERQLVEKSLYEQAMLLMDEDFYASKHNHGMYQDFGLLVYTLLVEKNDEEKANNLQTVFARTGEYLNSVFTKDGVHKEHSPYFARDVFAEARRFIKIAKDICPTFSEDIEEMTKNTGHYLVQLIKPNGMWPSIGDSPESSMKNGMKMIEDTPEYQYLISKGTKGIRPKENMVFPQGGYAFMRSSWDDKAHEATWMMLIAATFSSTHKHGDDLNFLLYHKGDLFVEAGKRDYKYSNEQTAWVYSAYAHNVLLVNGEGFPVKIERNGFQSIYPDALQTQILDYDMNGDIKWVKASQKRYEDIVQERTVSYDKARALVSVEDCITSTKDFDGTLLYHLAEDIRVELTDCGWNLYREEELVASVLVRSEEKYTLTSITGNEGKSPYNTWIFGGASEPSFGSLLKVDVSCHAGETKVVLDVFLK